MTKLLIWIRGMLAAAISGASGGTLTGFAAVGIDPSASQSASRHRLDMRIGLATAIINAVIGVCAANRERGS